MKNHPIALATSLLFALLAALLLLRRDGDVTRAQTPSDATAQTTSADSPIPGVPPTPAPPEERNAGEAPTARREAAPAERVPGTEPEEEVPEGLVVELRWSDGSPVPGAWVSLAKDGRRLETAYSDWKGRVHYGPLEEEGVWLYVANGSVRLASLPLGKRSGLVRVTLEEGSTVSGWVRIQGNAPDRSLNLHLVADPDGPAAPLMPALDDPMGGTVEADVADLWATTDEEGAFRFAGLPAHFRGSIQLPYGDEFVTGGSSLPVEAPTTDLILDIEARPVLRGRVVDGEGNPVPGAFVFADISTKEGGVGSAETADEEGRFTVALPKSGLEQARLSISGLGTNTDVVVREFDPVRGADAGDIVLEREELDSADFLVTDSDGTPLPDAIVGVLSQTKTASSQGICSFEFPRTQGLQATVWAPDHVVRVLPVPPAADRPDGPIEVALERATTLEVTVTDPAGAPVRGVVVRASGNPLFAVVPDQELLLFPDLRRPHLRYVETDPEDAAAGTVRAVYRFEDAESVPIGPLAPGSAITLEVLGRDASQVAWTETLEPPPGERTLEKIVLPVSPSEVAGTVQDESGHPLSARIEFPEAEFSSGVRTDEEGRFRAAPLFSDTETLLVTADGYAPLLKRDAPTGVELELTLTSGTPHDVLVEDTEGRAIEDCMVWARDGSLEVATAEPTEGAGFHFEHLPDGPLELVADIHGAEFAAPPSDSGTTRIEVPVMGSLDIRWSLADPDSHEDLFLRFAPEEDPERFGQEWIRADAENRFYFRSVVPGTYTLEAFADWELAHRTRVQILPGETAELSFQDP